MPLDRKIIAQVVDKFIFELESQLAEQGVTLQYTTQAREWLADRGYDPQMGARPMARVIQEYVKKPLAEDLLFGRLAEGGHVKFYVQDGELKFSVEDRKPVTPA